MKVGDTITHIARPCKEAIAGFEEVKPMVFAGVYPIEAEDFEDLRSSFEKLQLNDASLTFQPESSLALGFGFRCGFLGLLHMEIVQERLDREFDMNVITTVPNVSYNIYDKQGHMTEVHNPGSMPDPTLIDRIEEPYIRASVITTTDYIGPIMTPVSYTHLNEILNNSLTRAAYYDGLESYPSKNLVMLLNPLSADLNAMRQTLLFGGLESISHNANRKNADLKFFEFGNCYHYNEEKKNPEKVLAAYSENYHLGLWVTGKKVSTSWAHPDEHSSVYELKAYLSLIHI